MNDARLEEPRDLYVESDGVRLRCVERGTPQDETLLLVHGSRDQCRSWDFFAAALEKLHPAGLHIVAVDLRGHGDSEWAAPGRGYRHEDFVRDLAAVFHRIGKEKINLVGHSFGGSMAVLFAGSFPERVKRLVLVEATGPFAKRAEEVPGIFAEQVEVKEIRLQRTCHADLDEAQAAIKKRFPSIPDDACRYMARFGTAAADSGLVWKHDPRLRLRSLSAFSEEQIRAFIGRISCPTLIVYGAESEFTRSSRASRLPLFANAKLVAVPAAGHHVPHERPAELARAVSSFLLAT
ncbi:MAG TPA: alpha/beta hydrolase [Candidatus Acidoferrales bacterium]|nr:alpha/beta hydrolase [Candidatus Acidoferrales bacterium]